MIRAQLDARGARVQLDDLARNALPQAVARALNRTATSARAEVIRRIRRELPISARSLRGRLRLFRAQRLRLQASVRATRDYDPPLGLFAPRWRQRQPVGATIKLPGRARQAVPGAFVARTSYGREAVFRRVGRERRPIKFLRASDVGAPTVSASFLQALADGAVVGRAQARFAREIEAEMRFRRG
jgi:hypothetical protein